MEIKKTRRMLELTQAQFGKLVGTHDRNIRLYEKEPDKTPWTIQSRGNRAIGPRYVVGTDIDDLEYLIRLHRPGLVAEVSKQGPGHSLAVIAWLDPTPVGKELKEVLNELRSYWKLHNNR